MERIKLKEFFGDYLLSGKYICVSGRTGKRLCSSSNSKAYKKKFFDREVLSIKLDIIVQNSIAYPMMKIWISDYNNPTKDDSK